MLDDIDCPQPPTLQTLLSQDTPFDLDHIQPTAMRWGEMQVHVAGDGACLRGRVGLVHGCRGMGVEVVQHQAERLYCWEVYRHQLVQEMGEVLGGAS